MHEFLIFQLITSFKTCTFQYQIDLYKKTGDKSIKQLLYISLKLFNKSCSANQNTAREFYISD